MEWNLAGVGKHLQVVLRISERHIVSINASASWCTFKGHLFVEVVGEITCSKNKSV